MAQDKGLQYLDMNSSYYVRLLRVGQSSQILAETAPDLYNSFISCEGLLGWDPFEWHERVDFLSGQLPTDTRIILTVRKPRDYLYSTFIQQTLHSGAILKPSQFFMGGELYRLNCAHPKFSMRHFHLEDLIAKLNSHFNEVSVIPFEDIISGQFMGFEIGQKKRENRSLGSLSYKVLGGLDYTLSRIGLSLASGEIRRSVEETIMLSGGVPPTRRFPFRTMLSWFDHGNKITEVYRVIDSFSEIMEREIKFYASLSRDRVDEPVS